MSEKPPAQPAAGTEPDPIIRRLREFVSAGIALVVILGSVIMLVQAFNYLSTPDEFDRVKDLLLLINPLLGVVVGYYFNRVTSEPRAEKAETAATAAMATAQQASEAQNQAEAEAKAAKGEAKEVKEALKEVDQAAEKMMDLMPAPAVGVLSVDGEPGEPATAEARLELQMALRHARRFMD
jgi:hypothetical protein